LILSSDLTLEAVLGGAVAANQPEFHVDYVIFNNQGANSKPAVARGALNSTTDVTLISPSANGYSTQGFIAEVKGLSIYNKDTSSVTVTVKTTDGTDRIKCKATLETNEFLSYANGIWQAFTSDGSLKTNAISYAEGTWTPVLTFATPGDLSITYNAQIGAYTKIGRLVHLSIDVQTSSFTYTTASGAMNITGSPYTALASPAVTPRGDCAWQGITKANFTQASFAFGAGSSTVLIQMSGSGQALTTLTATDMPTGGTVILRGNITFQV
jgi:hypothetical protein